MMMMMMMMMMMVVVVVLLMLLMLLMLLRLLKIKDERVGAVEVEKRRTGVTISLRRRDSERLDSPPKPEDS